MKFLWVLPIVFLLVCSIFSDKVAAHEVCPRDDRLGNDGFEVAIGDLHYIGKNITSITIRGEAAKRIFDAMPDSSRLTLKEFCDESAAMKIQGGLRCTHMHYLETVAPDGIHYYCVTEFLTKTGKAIEYGRNWPCDMKPD
jgi:hypothetical protein